MEVFLFRKKDVIGGAAAVLLFASVSAWAADSGAEAFAKKIYEVTKSGNYSAYEALFDARCHPRSFTSKSFELRSDVLKKLNPGVTVEAMPLADYQAMMKQKGAGPDLRVYVVQPSHIVIVHGTVPGVAGGDRVELGPIFRSKDDWTLLEGDCLSNGPPKGQNR